MISTILQVIIAIPKIIELIGGLWRIVQRIKTEARIDELQKAISNGDTLKAEELLDNPRAGLPSNLDGTELRPKKAN